MYTKCWPDRGGLVYLRRCTAITLMAALVFQWAGPASAATPSEPLVRLPGHVLAAITTARPLPPTPGADAQPITLTIVLNRADQVGFDRYLRDVNEPKSPGFRKFLRQNEITTRFGPTQTAYNDVLAYLTQHGFTVAQNSANRLTITVRGTRAQAERAFKVRIGDFQIGDRRMYANADDPVLPAHIGRNVQAIAGLSNAAVPAAPLGQATPQELENCSWLLTKPGARPFVYGSLVVALLETVVAIFLPTVWFVALTSGAVGTITPAWYCIGLYYGTQLGPSLGFGSHAAAITKTAASQSPVTPAAVTNTQTIGLLEFDTFRPSDVQDWLALGGADPSIASRVSSVPINGGVASPGPSQSEVLLDIAMVMITDPSPSVRYVVYHAPGNTSFQQLFNAMINDGVTVISNSWSQCEDQTSLAEAQSIDSVLAQAGASGISVLNGSGDSGSTCLDGSPNTVGIPASSPHATAVGGTTPLPGGPGYTYGGEAWWNGSARVPPTGQGGFGLSRYFERPMYQNGLNGSAMRSVPDIAVAADPRAGVALCEADAGGCPTGLIYGGTSMAAPEMAGMVALLNEVLGSNIGEVNPVLYSLQGTNAFHSAASMASDFAHVGLGSPHFNYLRLALSHQSIGPVSASASLVTASPTVPADGETTGLVQVNLFDANGFPVSGRTVTLTATPSGNVVISPASGVSDVHSGAVAFTVKNAQIQDVTFTATDTTDPVQITNTAKVSFVSPPAAAGGIVAAPTTVSADGHTSTTITVTLQDAKGNGAQGKVVTLSQGSGHSIITAPVPAVTDTNGKIQFTATDTVGEVVPYTAVDVTDMNLPVPGSANVTFTGAGVSCLTPPTAATGFAITPFATGFLAENFFFANINFVGCPGASNPAFDPSGNAFVADFVNGNLYKVGAGGGAVSTANLVSILGPTFGNVVADQNGNFYGTYFSPSEIVQINPTTGAVMRIIASGFTCPSGLVIDPQSGDLFFNDACTGAGTDNASVWRIHNPSGPSPTTTVYADLPATPGGSMAFAPNGTLYAVAAAINNPSMPIVRIAGTNMPAPPVVTTLPGVTSDDGSLQIGATDANGEAVSLITNSGGNLELIDIANPSTRTTLASGTIGAGVIGPDGCLYADAHDKILRLAPTSGTCGFTPTNPAPGLSLGPATVSPNPAQGTPETFTASLHNIDQPEGTPITFMVAGANPQGKMVRADSNGQASFTYTGISTGSDTVVATANPNGTPLASSNAQVTWTSGRHTTFLTLNQSPTAGTVGQPVTLSASLTDVSVTPPAVIANAAINFTLGDQACVGMTDATGSASCQVTPDASGFLALGATFAATAQSLGSTAATGFTALGPPQQPTTLTYTGPTVLADAQPANLTAVLKAGATPVNGESVTITLGSGAGAQACVGTTDGTGTARCTIASVNQPLGPGTIGASFAGDASFQESSTTVKSLFFDFVPGGGSFVLGDESARVGAKATFWGYSWAKANMLSGGGAPASFDGFSTTVSACGGNWTSEPGNSSTPPTAIPSYMGVLVSSSIGKMGTSISGNVTEIVVVKPDPGYSRNPGHPGTGTVVGVYCRQ